MMKNLLSLSFSATILTMLIASCGQKQTEFELKPQSIEIKGELSEFYSIVDGTYKLSPDEKYNMPNHYQLKVQLKRSSKEFNFDPKTTISLVGGFNIFCDLLDEQTAPVVLSTRDGMIIQGSSEGIDPISNLKAGETGWIIYHFTLETDVIEKIKTFSLDSKSGANLPISSGASSQSLDESSDETTTNFDCDQFIRDYSDFADSYVKLMKKYKANPNDTSIVSDYTEAAQKALEMQKNASLCSDPKYAAKLIEIAKKIASVL